MERNIGSLNYLAPGGTYKQDTRFDVFAATPPVEALRVQFSMPILAGLSHHRGRGNASRPGMSESVDERNMFWFLRVTWNSSVRDSHIVG